MTRIAVMGAAGRMGKVLIEAVHQAPDVSLGAAIVSPNSSLLGVDAGELVGVGKLGVRLKNSIAAAADDFDVLIDFTNPDLTLANLAECVRLKKAMVIFPTGFSLYLRQLLSVHSHLTPLLFAPSLSVFFNLILLILSL